MSDPENLTIGSFVECSDGPCGQLVRIVVDPVARSITHLVIEPKRRPNDGRLVPINLVINTTLDIRLDCTTTQFAALDTAIETQFLPGANGEWGYRQDQIISWPFYARASAGISDGNMDPAAGPAVEKFDRVPDGDVEVRRGDHVHATDGDIGRVQGLVIDRANYTVTHVLLDEGHLWGEKRVAIPIGAVASVENGVRLTLTKDEVRHLPSVWLEHSS
jgi:hypothetical protein